ncbi:MAG TPA: VOC family protein [Bacteroidia bacterium]|nr:VOC family protein [Bacteroidia bacterium]
MKNIIFILYVKNQALSRDFYSEVFGIKPVLDVPGMTEFELLEGTKLGLMPEKNIAKIISPPLPDPSSANGIPRCEVYLYVENPAEYIARAIAAGGKLVNELSPRDWGDRAGYIADADGNVVVFAEKM